MDNDRINELRNKLNIVDVISSYIPLTKKGRLVFGFGCGLITFLIRKFGGYPEGVMFSILIMNSVAPFLNNLTARKYGYGKKEAK